MNITKITTKIIGILMMLLLCVSVAQSASKASLSERVRILSMDMAIFRSIIFFAREDSYYKNLLSPSVEDTSLANANKVFKIATGLDLIKTHPKTIVASSLKTDKLHKAFQQATQVLARTLGEQIGDKHMRYENDFQSQLSKEEYDNFVVGIGIVIGAEEVNNTIYDRFQIKHVIKNTPAFHAGLKKYDVIISVQNKQNGPYLSLKGTLYEATKLIKDKVGTNLNVLIERDGKVLLPISLTREKIDYPPITKTALFKTIAYVKLERFSKQACDTLVYEYKRLINNGAQALILDLRNDLGGFLSQAICVSNLFASKTSEVMIDYRTADETKLIKTFEPLKFQSIPFVVLGNNASASASEVVIGFVTKHKSNQKKRAIFIGEKTYGKGSAQNRKELINGTYFLYTTALFCFVDNTCHEGSGIQPDIVAKPTMRKLRYKGQIELVPNTRAFGDPKNDAQLKTAIDYLNNTLSKTTVD